MRLLLDTVALIFSVESPERLTKRATGILQNTENILELSAISLSEIAVKAARGKLKFSAADTRHALEDLDIRILPYTANHAFFLFDPTAPARGSLRPSDYRPGFMRRDPGDDLRRKIQPVPRSQGPLVILRNLASRNDHTRARVSSVRSYVSDPAGPDLNGGPGWT